MTVKPGAVRIEAFRRRVRRLRRDLSWKRLRRWVTWRCAECGRRFFWHDSINGYGGADHFHDRCMAYRMWRGKAEERLEILDLVAEVWDVDAATVYALAEGRAQTGVDPDGPEVRDYNQSRAWDKAWRVFNDLENRRKPKVRA